MCVGDGLTMAWRSSLYKVRSVEFALQRISASKTADRRTQNYSSTIPLEQLDNDEFTAIIVPSNPEFLIRPGQLPPVEHTRDLLV